MENKIPYFTHYVMQKASPSVDIDFFISLLKDNPKVQVMLNVNDTHSYIIKGNAALGKRMMLIRATKGNVDLEFATGAAIRLKCLPELLQWLEQNRGWKDGAYSDTLLKVMNKKHP